MTRKEPTLLGANEPEPNKQPLILVVADNPIEGRLYYEGLQIYGYTAVITRTAQEALEWLPTLHPALILVDYELGKDSQLNGLQLTEQIRNLPDSEQAQLPVILHTVYDNSQLSHLIPHGKATQLDLIVQPKAAFVDQTLPLIQNLLSQNQ